MSSSRFILSYTFPDNSFLQEQDSGDYKYWEGEGLPNYEGTINGFAEKYPEKMQYLVSKKIFKVR